jgi:hypothetical protein
MLIVNTFVDIALAVETGPFLAGGSARYGCSIKATVEILAIVAKSGAESWLAQFGDPE